MYEKLEALLKERGISIPQLCADTGIGQSTISNLKIRRTEFSMKNAKLVADYLGVPIEALIG